MSTFYTPPGFSGSAELTAANGLQVIDQGLWRYSQAGYNDGATFGLSLTHPSPLDGKELHLRAQGWTISGVGNQLTEYIDPQTQQVYPADTCRITVTGNWQVIRQANSNSYNSFGVSWNAKTLTNLGGNDSNPYLLSFSSKLVTYTIQGSAVEGGAVDNFTDQEFWIRATESASSVNSNKEFQSNTIVRPVFVYNYSKSWQIPD